MDKLTSCRHIGSGKKHFATPSQKAIIQDMCQKGDSGGNNYWVAGPFILIFLSAYALIDFDGRTLVRRAGSSTQKSFGPPDVHLSLISFAWGFE